MMCDCEDKIVLEEGDGMYEASEYWCKEHGYYTSCCVCDPQVTTTERCMKHGRCAKHRDWISNFERTFQ